MTRSAPRWAIAFLLGGLVSTAAYWRGTLTRGGALAATGVGTVAFARGGAPGAAALLAFFVSSSALSRVGEQRKRGHAAKGGRGDAWQVLANGGAATASLLLGSNGGFVGGLAAASADTWATEVGMLARGRPRLITSGQVVDRGVSGGVTVHGLVASAGGAACVGLAWAICARERTAVPVALQAGVVGSLLDSLLGATIQSLYRCERCGQLTEQRLHHETATRLVHGFAAIDNDGVNALSTLGAAALGALMGLSRR